jgi:hypothetical protein
MKYKEYYATIPIGHQLVEDDKIDHFLIVICTTAPKGVSVAHTKGWRRGKIGRETERKLRDNGYTR